MALFYFLRHGETAWNAEGRLCGSTDVPLSVAGRRQAELLTLRLAPLKSLALYSSPLSRALETARIIGRTIALEPVVDARLAELNYGVWEGSTFEDIARDWPEIYQSWGADPGSLAPPGGETGVHLVERAAPFLAEMGERHPHGNVVVVCHKTVIRLLACHLMGVPLAEYRRRIPMDNAALNVFESRAGAWRVVTLNDTSHLAAGEAAP